MHLLASVLSLWGPKASAENQAVSSLTETTYLILGVYLYPAKSGLLLACLSNSHFYHRDMLSCSAVCSSLLADSFLIHEIFLRLIQRRSNAFPQLCD